MKYLLLLLLSLPMTSHAVLWEMFQYPEDNTTYTNADNNYRRYNAPSTHGTGNYSLTFDDGPHPTRTALILNILKKYNAKATFFVVTSQITNANFYLIKRMLDEGHIVASHGRNHDNSNEISKAVWKSRVKQSFVELNKLYMRAGHVFDKFYYRFPYAAYGRRSDHHHFNTLKEISRELMDENCIQFAFWDQDSGDWIPGMTASEVFGNLKATNEGGPFVTYKTVKKPNGSSTQIKVHTQMDNPTNGGVILQHDIQESSVDGTDQFLRYAAQNNLSIVRLDEVEEFKVTKQCKMKE